MPVLLDSHALHWWASEPDRLSPTARRTLQNADELVLASVSWYELAWLAQHSRVTIHVPLRVWLDDLAKEVRTVATTRAIAATAVELPPSFPSDPADRVIFATAIEHRWKLVTKDERILRYKHPTKIAVW